VVEVVPADEQVVDGGQEVARLGALDDAVVEFPGEIATRAISFVRYYDGDITTDIGRGENAGATITYTNVVRDLKSYANVSAGSYRIGELYDLEKDPNEFENLWNDPDYAGLRFDLMRRNFDALAFAVDPGPPQVTPF